MIHMHKIMAKFPRSGQHYSRLAGIYISSATNYITLLQETTNVRSVPY